MGELCDYCIAAGTCPGYCPGMACIYDDSEFEDWELYDY